LRKGELSNEEEWDEALGRIELSRLPRCTRCNYSKSALDPPYRGMAASKAYLTSSILPGPTSTTVPNPPSSALELLLLLLSLPWAESPVGSTIDPPTLERSTCSGLVPEVEGVRRKLFLLPENSDLRLTRRLREAEPSPTVEAGEDEAEETAGEEGERKNREEEGWAGEGVSGGGSEGAEGEEESEEEVLE
jgi:hypothetical protein